MNEQNFPYQLRDLNFDYSLDFKFNPKGKAFKGMPNNEKFNGDNRYEMVFLINALQKQWGLSSIDDCEKIEYLIKTCMPKSISTQLEVSDWLVLNWNNYQQPLLATAI